MISIIGSGRVGSSIAFLCVSNAIDDVLLLNTSKEKAMGEALDIASAIPEDSKFSIHGTDDYSEIAGSDVVIISASVAMYQTDRAENIKAQVEMIKEIADKVKQYCPSAIVLMISNPLDVLTYFFQKQSGFPRFKVIGVASSLDSSRFRYYISEKLSVPQSSISKAMVVGEHGDSMIPIFSNVQVNAKPLLDEISDDDVTEMTENVRNYWKTLRNYKSRSQFGIAKNAYDVIYAIKKSQDLEISASVVLENEYGESDLSIGVPVKINQAGVVEIQNISLNESENESLKSSAQKIRSQISSISN